MKQLVHQQLDHFRLDEVLGEGGMGAVFRAHDLKLQRDVAIKVMHDHFASQPDFQERFLREARSAAQLNHTGIIKIHELGEPQAGDDPPRIYIVMEYIQGGNLREHLHTLHENGQQMSLSDAVDLVHQVSMAIDYAHQQGILHRDIKPSNIMLKRGSVSTVATQPADIQPAAFQPVVMDFGLAQFFQEEDANRPQSSIGTPAYMSPEHATGAVMDERSDIYSLGVLLYELTTGQLPYPARSVQDIIRYHGQSPVAPQEIRSEIPAEIESATLRAISPQPANRFPSAQAFAVALGGISSAYPEPTVPATVQRGSVYTPEPTVVDEQTDIREESLWQGLPTRDPNADPNLLQLQILGPDRSYAFFQPEGRRIDIGSDSSNDIVLIDDKVSPHHASVEEVEDRLVVLVRANTEHTYLGTQRLFSGIPEPWIEGKMLRVGDHYIRQVGPQKQPYPDAGLKTLATQQLTHPMAGSTVGGRARIYLPDQVRNWTVRPGSSILIPLVIMNQGAARDQFAISLTDLPADWVKLPPPLWLEPNQQQDVVITVTPPRGSESLAENYPISIIATSQTDPAENANLVGMIIVEEVIHFRSTLQPLAFRTNQTTSLTIENQGNATQTYQISWQGSENSILFEPQQTRVEVAPGKNISTTFRARLRERRFAGGPKPHIASVMVKSGSGQEQHSVRVRSHAFLPIWAAILLPLLFAGLIGLAWNTFQSYRGAQVAATQTAETAAQNIIATSTKVAQGTSTAIAVGIADMTATADWLIKDNDKDGLTNAEELEIGTLPDVRDTDRDGLSDGDEVNIWGTEPLNDDTDGDQLKDGTEIIRKLNALSRDTDNDKLEDNVDPDPNTPLVESPNGPMSQDEADANGNGSGSSDKPQPTATPIKEGCVVVADMGLKLRKGPGQYFPIVETLPQHCSLKPLAYQKEGVPDKQWIKVYVVGTELKGWVAYKDGKTYVKCAEHIAVDKLPPPDCHNCKTEE